LIVSGLVTSPDDHPLICSGDARLIRIASKLLTSSMSGFKTPAAA
jgi:hypothetical protein